ncbi:MAG: hypothetical protein Q9180_009758, partial [Flavoplaca navasiana]
IRPERMGRLFKPAKDEPQNDKAGNKIDFPDSDSDLGSVSSVEDQEFDSEASYSDEDEDTDPEAAAVRWKENLADRAKSLHRTERSYRASDLYKLFYDTTLRPADVARRWRGEVTEEISPKDADDDKGEEDNFFKKSTRDEEEEDLEDRMVPKLDYEALAIKWSDPDNLEKLRQRFTSARISHGTEANGDADSASENDDEGDGDFEDLEKQSKSSNKNVEDTELSLQAEREKNARKKEELKLRFEEEDKEGFGKINDKTADGPNEEKEFGEDDWYEAQKAQDQKRRDINQAELDLMDANARLGVEGHKAGTYARI